MLSEAEAGLTAANEKLAYVEETCRRPIIGWIYRICKLNLAQEEQHLARRRMIIMEKIAREQIPARLEYETKQQMIDVSTDSCRDPKINLFVEYQAKIAERKTEARLFEELHSLAPKLNERLLDGIEDMGKAIERLDALRSALKKEGVDFSMYDGFELPALVDAKDLDEAAATCSRFRFSLIAALRQLPAFAQVSKKAAEMLEQERDAKFAEYRERAIATLPENLRRLAA
jgi:hypothetical protein